MPPVPGTLLLCEPFVLAALRFRATPLYPCLLLLGLESPLARVPLRRRRSRRPSCRQLLDRCGPLAPRDRSDRYSLTLAVNPARPGGLLVARFIAIGVPLTEVNDGCPERQGAGHLAPCGSRAFARPRSDSIPASEQLQLQFARPAHAAGESRPASSTGAAGSARANADSILSPIKRERTGRAHAGDDSVWGHRCPALLRAGIAGLRGGLRADAAHPRPVCT